MNSSSRQTRASAGVAAKANKENRARINRDFASFVALEGFHQSCPRTSVVSGNRE